MTSFTSGDMARIRMPHPRDQTRAEVTQTIVAMWADKTFGDFDAEAVLKHLEEELHELSASLRLMDKPHVILEECADVVLLVMQIASSLRGSLERAVNLKHQDNQTDEWEYRPELGYSKRVKS